MNKMLVGIDYTDDGSRVISHLSFYSIRNDIKFNELSESFKNLHDEAYIINIDPNCEVFINEIVTKGCRL